MHRQAPDQITTAWNRSVRHPAHLSAVTALIAMTAMIGFVLSVSLRASAWAAHPLSCRIQPNATVSVGSSVVGVLDSVTVNQGDYVKAGDVIARLESRLEEAEVAVAQAKADMVGPVQKAQVQIDFSGRKVTRAKDLSKTSAIAQHEVDEAETEHRLAEVSQREALEQKRLAELELKRAETALSLRTIRSPIAGVVVDRLLFPGELVKQSPLLTIAQVDPLRVEVVAPASMLNKLKPGMRADIRVDWNGATPYQAKIAQINPVIEHATGTVAVQLELPNPQHRIPPGLGCSVTFVP